jgi:MoxR-like ATPase
MLMEKTIKKILEGIDSVILDKSDQVELIFATWLMGGHVLLEDLPGTGKTVLAKAFAKICKTSFGRVQFTPDLLPGDILGTTIYDAETKKFYFRKGPIFSNFFLADEINRATPRTQSALLEAMGEGQITIENRTTDLPKNFMVIATQNPLESHGTFPLPEAQLDRFTVKISLGGLDLDGERRMLKSQEKCHPLDNLKPVISEENFLEIQKAVKSIVFSDDIVEYLLKIMQFTRKDHRILYGASSRATLAYKSLAQAIALIKGRDYVIPNDVYSIAVPVLNHRIILTEDSIFEGTTTEDVIKDILKQVKAPRL